MPSRSRKKSSPALRRGGGKYGDQPLRNSFVPAQNQTLGGEMESPGKRTASGNGHSKFTLLEEVKNTERRHNSWNKDSRLRHTPINFLSAGKFDANKEINAKLLNGKTDDKQLVGLSDSSAKDNSEQAHMALAAGEGQLLNQEAGSNETARISGNSASCSPVPEVDRPLFVVDVKRSEAPIKTGFSSPRIPPPSPTSSQSSQELILFTGRYKTHDLKDVKGKSKNREEEEDGRSPQSEHEPSSGIRVIDDPPSISLDLLTNETTIELKVPASAEANGKAEKTRSRNRGQGRKSKEKDAEDAMLADYIANMVEHGEGHTLDKESYNRRDIGGQEFDLGNDGHATVPQISAAPGVTARDGWASSDLQDLENLSTSDEVLGSIQHILAKRTRANGLQYLIVWEGQTTDDARWILSSSLTMAGAVDQIRAFEDKEIEKKKITIADVDDLSHSSDFEWKPDPHDDSDQESDEEDDEEEERFKDNEDLMQRKIARMTDEKIARLLSKQEELGMGSDELLLFDDEDDEVGYEADDNDIQGEGENLEYSSTLGRDHKRYEGGLTATSLMEAYAGFDIMDRDRPSLQKKAKGRAGPLPFELSDPELESNLRTAWEKDRSKKSIRKQEREELRAQGLLGKKSKERTGPYNQYSNGIDIEKVKSDIKELLLSTDETLSLPPMDNRNRRIVHEIANAFRLKSKSTGSGRSRFPMLIKTRSTPSFNQGAFEAAEASLRHRRFFLRMEKGNDKRSDKQHHQSGKGGFNNSAVSYRDGDVVGAAAPELGAENKGRAMLEKMGWSIGTALGALDNKGILTPVEHIVKTSKAGLG